MQEDKKYFIISKKGVAIIVLVCIAASALFGFSGAFVGNFVADIVLAEESSNSRTTETGSLFGKRENTDSNKSESGGKNTTAATMNLAEATRSELSIQEIVELNANAVVEIRTDTSQADRMLA